MKRLTDTEHNKLLKRMYKTKNTTEYIAMIRPLTLERQCEYFTHLGKFMRTQETQENNPNYNLEENNPNFCIWCDTYITSITNIKKHLTCKSHKKKRFLIMDNVLHNKLNMDCIKSICEFL
jgi:hypothetical protein